MTSQLNKRILTADNLADLRCGCLKRKMIGFNVIEYELSAPHKVISFQKSKISEHCSF